MITVEQYFGEKPHDEEQWVKALDLLDRVNKLIAEAVKAGQFSEVKDPDTGTQISGSRHGRGDGGFRLPDSPTGSPKSSHKRAMGVDVFDPVGRLDQWLTDAILEKHGLYREAPAYTFGWVHLQTRTPLSGKRTFTP